jgi:hypothetical protein
MKRGKKDNEKMTSDDFRRIALSLPEACEQAHMGHPDFRVRKKIFATLGVPDNDWGMVKLTPELQKMWVRTEPAAFEPVNGAWGRQGCTRVCLAEVDEATLRDVLEAAWTNVAPKGLADQLEGA